METDKLIRHLASVLGDNFQLTLEDVENQETEADKEIVYGLICLHDDLHFYKEQSDLLLKNFKNTLFNSAAISITNSKGKIKDVNDLFLNLSGYSKNELLGKLLRVVDYKSNQTTDYERLISDITKGLTWRGEVCSVKKNKELFWLNTHIFPIKNTEGKIYEYWSVSTDITERKRIESELIRKNKELEHFSYMISHDIKSPSQQIQELAKFIKYDLEEGLSDDGKQAFDYLLSSANRLNSLIDGILAYSLIGKTATKDIAIDLNQLINKLISTLVVPDSIKIKIANHLPVIIGNEIKVEQIFENLISNAIKYMDKENGEIIISSTNTAEFFRFEVKDNGAGIKEIYFDSIFNMFETAHESSREDSTGIGLAIVRKIIEAYGGEIGCHSILKKGATFWFTWPKL